MAQKMEHLCKVCSNVKINNTSSEYCCGQKMQNFFDEETKDECKAREMDEMNHHRYDRKR